MSRQLSPRPIQQSLGTRPGGDTSCASGKDFNGWGGGDNNYKKTRKRPKPTFLRPVKCGATVSFVSRQGSSEPQRQRQLARWARRFGPSPPGCHSWLLHSEVGQEHFPFMRWFTRVSHSKRRWLVPLIKKKKKDNHLNIKKKKKEERVNGKH